MGLSEGKRLAIEGGKDLAAIGLTPLAAIEKAGKELQWGAAMREMKFRTGRIHQFEQMPRFKEYTELLRKESEPANEKLLRAYESMYKKGKILKLIEKLS